VKVAVKDTTPTRLKGQDAAAARLPLYFINAWADYALIGGLSIVTFLLLRHFYSQERTPEIILWGTWLMWAVNWPHFAATSYRLYHSQDNIRQYPLTALVIPWLILAAVAGSFLSPLLIAPYFVKLFTIWSPYHFSGQSLGITLIYARRAGFQVGRWQRLALSTFIFGTFITQTVRFEVFPQGSDFYGIKYPGLGLPEWTADAAETLMWVGGAFFLGFVVHWCWRNKRLLPPIVLLPAVTQFVWFVHSDRERCMSFREFVPFFHSLQYMLIAWSMQLKEKMDLNKIAPSPRYVAMESVRWWGLNFIFGVCLFFVLPHVIAETSWGVSLAFATGVVVTAIQIHHFFVDGVIWKLKRKTVASPLMVNIAELLSGPQGKAA
jgi:hypothetical protein